MIVLYLYFQYIYLLIYMENLLVNTLHIRLLYFLLRYSSITKMKRHPGIGRAQRGPV